MSTQATARTIRYQTLEGGPSLQERAQSTPAILTFFAIAFAWSWGLGFAAISAKAYSEALGTALLVAAGFGPSLAGVAVVALFSTGAGFRGWLARCWKWRMNWRWYALAFAGPPVAMVCALVLHAELGGAIPTLPAADKIPLVIANFALVLLIGGPLGEEFGWRGYAMPALTARLNWRAAALIVGVLWGLWHLPLFFLAGTAQSQIPIALFMINIVASSVVFGWLFEHTKRSVLPVIVLHTSVNAWAGILLLPLATTGETYALVTTFFVVVAVVLLFRTGSGPGLGRGDDATSQQSC